MDHSDRTYLLVGATRTVLSVNLIAPILLAQALAPALEGSGRGRILLNGALSGLPNAAAREVANTASKFGLQGAAESLHLSLAARGIGVTVVNLDNVATPEVLDDIEAGRFGPQVPIPIEDVLRTYDYVLSLNSATAPRSIDLQQRSGEMAGRP